MTTIRKIEQIISEFVTNHLQLRGYYWGTPQRAMTTTLEYPALIAYIASDGGNIKRHEAILNLNIIVIDKLEDSENNWLDVESDTFQIAMDTFAYLNTTILIQKIFITENATVIKIADAMKDKVCGWQMNIPVKLNYTHTTCSLPLSPPSQCADATAVLKNTLNNIISTTNIQSGAIKDIIAPDGSIDILRSNSTIIQNVSVPSNENTQTTIADSIIQNSDNTYNASVMATSTFTLPDESIDIFVNGLLYSTINIPPIGNNNITINV